MVEWNGGMENGMEQRMYTVLCNWHCSMYVELPSIILSAAISKSGMHCRQDSIFNHDTVASLSLGVWLQYSCEARMSHIKHVSGFTRLLL